MLSKIFLPAVACVFLMSPLRAYGDQQSLKEMIALMLNLNGYLCARVESVKPLQLPDAYEVQCIEYRGGTGSVRYRLDLNTGKAEHHDSLPGNVSSSGKLYDTYAGLVLEAVRINWKTPGKRNNDLTVQVRMQIDRAGNLQNCLIERGSGNSAFDKSVIIAVERTKQFPKPPSPALQDFLMNFSLKELGGDR